MKRFFHILILFASQLSFGRAPANQLDSIGNLITGCWRWDHYYGGFAWLPPQTPWDNVMLRFNRDALDSANQTVSYRTYVDSLLADSGRAAMGIDTNYASWFTLSPDVLGALAGAYPPINVRFYNDSIEFTHFNIADDFYYVFARDSCLADTVSVPPDTTQYAAIDSLIGLLTGCWLFHAYESWGQMHPADTTVYLRFSQDAQDSSNHTVTYHCYLDSTLIKTDRTSITPDTAGIQDYDGSFVEDVRGAVIGAIGGTIRDQYPTDFYYFNDTLKIWDLGILVDAPYLYFVKDSCLNETPPDTSDYEKVDSIIDVLEGCWKWDYYFGGFPGIPPTPAGKDVRIHFSQDAQDSTNHTISCSSYEDSVLQFSGRCSIDDTTAFPFYLLSCPIFDSIGIVGSPPLYFEFEGDTLLFPQQQFVDGYVYAFTMDSCLRDTTVSPPDSANYETIDSIIEILDGCWKWDHYFGGFAGLPVTPASGDVKIEFSRDGQDSTNHTVSCNSYEDSVLQFSGRCSIDDTTALPFYLLSCPIFDSIGIVGSPPLYFHFEGDTLLFPQQEFVDGFVYGFLKNCLPDDTTSIGSPGDELVYIYPNPASEQIIVYLKRHPSSRISICSAIGRMLAAMDARGDMERIVFNISSYPAGNYFIRVESPEAVLVRRFFIQR